jgi:hypothetical protein
MKRAVMGGIMAAAMLGAGAAQADAGLGIGVKAGLLGLGAEVTKSLTDTLNARLGVNSYKFNTSATESGTDFDIDLKWQSSALLLDWHPGGGTFRLTAGYLFNGNKLAMSVKPGSTYDIDGNTGTLGAGEYVNGDVSFDNGPYVGLGWGNAAKGTGFGMSVEIGAAYQGSPKVTLATNVVGVTQTDIDREQASLENSLDSYKWYPQVAIGVSYAF